MPQVLSELADQKEGARERESTSSAEDRVAWVMQFVEKEKHIEGLIEKLSVRLEQAAEKSLPAVVGAEGQLETVSCLAHALGAMNYSDRCIIRLHDVIVIRKGLNTAISYHQVVRDCLLGVVEKTRKPKVGREKGEG